jgi:ABC-2 type transport system permease protein
MESRAINYYSISANSLKAFDEAYVAAFSQSKASGGDDTQAAQAGYVAALNALNTYVDTLASQLGYTEDSIEYAELQGLVFYVININPQDMQNNFDAFYTTLGQEAPKYDISSIASDDRDSYRKSYAQKNSAIFLAGNMISESNIDAIVSKLASFSITKEDYASFTYTNESGDEVSMFTGESGFSYINDLANTTVITLNARVSYEVSNGKDETAATEEITKDLTSSFIASLPEDVSNALMELGEMDLYSLIVGSIFYKMAGLLLPIIYMIMCSNNLISGQVDSGSMAYVLSTSTKRKAVVFTQAVFLIGSLFAMFALTTVTSVVCLAILDSSEITLTYGQLILLNLGAFLTMFAMSGISFLASCFFNRSKYSMSIGGGLNIFFLVATILGLFGSPVLPSVVRLKALNYFNYVSIISLFDVVSITGDTLTFLWKWAILIVVGVICYVLGALKFEKKDLPL